MKKETGVIAMIGVLAVFAGCSGAFWGGTASGAGATGVAYEANARSQMNRLEEDYKAGRIDQREYEIRKDQIQRGSLVY